MLWFSMHHDGVCSKRWALGTPRHGVHTGQAHRWLGIADLASTQAAEGSKLSTRDDSSLESLESLERRALAGAQLRRDLDAFWRREGEKQESGEAGALIARAVHEVEQRIGHRTSPADWKVVKERARPYTYQITYAVTRLLGVEIRVSGSNPYRQPWLPEEGSYVILTLTSFGKALEHVRQRLSESEGTNDPEGSVH